jgi:hypothetical protein
MMRADVGDGMVSGDEGADGCVSTCSERWLRKVSLGK